MRTTRLSTYLIKLAGYKNKYNCKKTMDKFIDLIAPQGSGSIASIIELDPSQEAMKNMDTQTASPSYSYDRVHAYFKC